MTTMDAWLATQISEARAAHKRHSHSGMIGKAARALHAAEAFEAVRERIRGYHEGGTDRSVKGPTSSEAALAEDFIALADDLDVAAAMCTGSVGYSAGMYDAYRMAANDVRDVLVRHGWIKGDQSGADGEAGK